MMDNESPACIFEVNDMRLNKEFSWSGLKWDFSTKNQ